MMRLLFAATILVALVSSSAVVAAVPRTISYQGVLKDAGGVIVPDGEYDITFRIYDVATEGAALWNETQTLQVTAGIVSLTLGDVSGLDLPFDGLYWLGISIETHGELSPRIELTTAPYAMRAAVADSVSGVGPMTDDDWSFVGDDIYRGTGRVGIGTALPNAALHVDVSGDVAARFQSDVGERVGYSVIAANTGSYADGGAIAGEAHWTDGAGSGGFFRGGAVGVKGEVWPSGEQTYVGVRGYIDGSDQTGGGTNYGVYGEVAASSARRFSGTNIGVYGRATGSGTSYAGYFDGNVEVTGAVRTMGFRLAAAPGTGYVLTSDAAGTGTWQPLPTQGIGGGGNAGYLSRFTGSTTVGNSSVYDSGGMVGIGTTTPTTALEVDGTVYSTSGGFRFPDGSTQTTAAQGVVSQIDAGTGIVVTDPTGPTAMVAADVGTGADQVAAGDHDHDDDYVDDGAGEIDAADDFGFGAATHVTNLDADLLDGQEATAFAGSGHDHDAAYVNDDSGEIDGAADFRSTARPTSGWVFRRT